MAEKKERIIKIELTEEQAKHLLYTCEDMGDVYLQVEDPLEEFEFVNDVGRTLLDLKEVLIKEDLYHEKG